MVNEVAIAADAIDALSSLAVVFRGQKVDRRTCLIRPKPERCARGTNLDDLKVKA